MQSQRRLPEILKQNESDILNQWVSEQVSAPSMRRDLLSEAQLREQSRRFLAALRAALQEGDPLDIVGREWSEVRSVLASLSQERASQGFSSGETALFVFSLREPLLNSLRREPAESDGYFDQVRMVNVLLDRLGLFTTEAYVKTREEFIRRQQQDMLELSTPVVSLFAGILALPLIGTLDSARTQVVMETLLQRIVDTGASIAIIDITGVPTVDTLVAQHLLKTVAAARLMGAECIISGIRPQIAQTIVHLGVELKQVTTKASLADALALALRQNGVELRKVAPATTAEVGG